MEKLGRFSVEQDGIVWTVVDCKTSCVVASFSNNAAAWRYVDRQEREPISRAEDVADWIANKVESDA